MFCLLPTKTLTIHFLSIKVSFHDTDLYLHDRTLPVVEQIRSLDMDFDNRHLRDLEVVCLEMIMPLCVFLSFGLVLFLALWLLHECCH